MVYLVHWVWSWYKCHGQFVIKNLRIGALLTVLLCNLIEPQETIEGTLMFEEVHFISVYQSISINLEFLKENYHNFVHIEAEIKRRKSEQNLKLETEWSWPHIGINATIIVESSCFRFVCIHIHAHTHLYTHTCLYSHAHNGEKQTNKQASKYTGNQPVIPNSCC